MNKHHYHAFPFAGSHLNGTSTATSTTSTVDGAVTSHESHIADIRGVEVYDYLNPNLRSYIASSASADIDERSTVYRDYEGNTYDVDEMIELLYEMNDRLKRLEKYYIGQKLEELLTGDGEDN